LIPQDLSRQQLPQDEGFMKEAIRQAKKAEKRGEVPIGCVIVRGGKIIARGYNRRNTDHTALGHAEITAIRRASKAVGDWRLEDCTLYVTLEPCPMCAGAIVQARIPDVVIGAMNPKAGCAGSVINLLQLPGLNHRCRITRGVLASQSSGLLRSFFAAMRQSRSESRANCSRVSASPRT
jgi:tRNA(adenine34) deaminase